MADPRVHYDEEGEDSNDKPYESLEEMWKAEVETKDVKEKDGWYGKAVAYWEAIDPTVDGMLGGFETISDTDLRGSAMFLEALKKSMGLNYGSVLDCGAGIGRISKGLLCQMFQHVDLVEQCTPFVERAKEELKDKIQFKEAYNVGLQDFSPEDGKYDVIWIQWVLGHLTDKDLVEFFERCQKGLKPNGLIIVKENNSSTGFIVDKDDSSVTRTNQHLKHIFEASNLESVRVQRQLGFPDDLFAVRMYALKPKPSA